MTTAKVRSQYHHGDLESALISTARKLVKQDGAEHLSLRQVSHEIGVSPSAAYHYFPDRTALLSGLGFSLFEELADFQEKEISKIPGNSARAARERFRALGRTYFQWAKKEPHLFNLMFGDLCTLEKVDQKNHEDARAFNNLTKCLDELYEFDLISEKMRPYGELLAWSVVHGATSLIIGGHLEPENFETTLDAVELALGIKR
ncbi:MAG: TetR/AcrR family transcriptional regulator [Actinobacteria bacterium]|jgi:AcrR family transcriptional regulator|nr:TetR/AcrR family transcriptional regulator [Actinomycetota bacterium]NDA94825.1 TetR/AcrR family transcriptional regulator [Actinomycetota bacterium]NDH80664.1 TetR/AcrR family transcriptional regulator [Actinomycetota bacterium]NDH98993.1 TetR/AcrR family transcriptional regulator [Actinomycetota bacterium]NDI07247.1 TetR/AcrR family transcriptional regulator [Actinomycetota bacterium]